MRTRAHSASQSTSQNRFTTGQNPGALRFDPVALDTGPAEYERIDPVRLLPQLLGTLQPVVVGAAGEFYVNTRLPHPCPEGTDGRPVGPKFREARRRIRAALQHGGMAHASRAQGDDRRDGARRMARRVVQPDAGAAECEAMAVRDLQPRAGAWSGSVRATRSQSAGIISTRAPYRSADPLTRKVGAAHAPIPGRGWCAGGPPRRRSARSRCRRWHRAPLRLPQGRAKC